MLTRLIFTTLTVLLGAACGHASGAEIVLEQSAVQKLVTEGLFKNSGRFDLQSGACQSYLEYPTVTLRGGRIIIRSHLSGRFGIDVGGNCIGVGLASWTVVSGAAGADQAVVRLTDLRIDQVDDPNTRAVLNSGLFPALPSAVELNVLKAVQDMLRSASSSGQIQAEVQALNIEAVTAADDKLSIRFDFKLVGR